MRLLVPDAERTQRPDMVWCLPVSEGQFDKLCKLAEKFKCFSPSGVPYLHRIGQRREKIILVMHAMLTHTEDEILEACAWIRLIKDKQQPIYIVPCGDELELTQAQIINRAMGASPGQIQSLDSLTEDKEEEGP